MDRRKFAQQAAATIACYRMSAAYAQATTARTGTSPNQLGTQFSVMLWALPKQATFDERLEIVASAGYTGVELTGEFQHWSDTQMQHVLSKVHTLRLTIDSMSGVRAGFAVPEQTPLFRTQFAEHLQFAQRLTCPQVILLSGRRVPGLAPGIQRATAIRNLTWAGNLARQAGIEIVIEPIDLLEDPNTDLSSVTDAFDLAQAVGMPGVLVLFDFYHEQRGSGNLIEKLEGHINLVGLVHVADVPGRHEPGTGEIAYTNIYRKLATLKYKRRIAMEYYPTGDPVTSLRNARMDAEAGLLAGA